MTYHEYIKSPQWAVIARQAKKRAGFRCQLCDATGTLHAHHRTYERLGDESDADITVLCADCHGRFHDKVKSWKDTWLATVRAERPVLYNVYVAQSDSIQIDAAGNVWLVFGAMAHAPLIGMFDGKELCGRTVRVAKTLTRSRSRALELVEGYEVADAAMLKARDQ